MLVGRVWLDGSGPVLVRVTPECVLDISALAPTMTALLELDDPTSRVAACKGVPLGATAAVLANSAHDRRDAATPWMLSPCDLQAIKASGVTFVSSMLERVIEEQARGDATLALKIRETVTSVIGDNLARIKPGSPEAARLKHVLIDQRMWSQYLEVGIGPDAEIFTKSQPMSSIGTGGQIGLHPESAWNNPEPEIVLVMDSRARVKGAALGNDVNLRDFEGRSALLLGKAKDNNGSCAIGPFIRLFNASFGMGDVRRCDLEVEVHGEDGYHLKGGSSIAMISRDPLELVAQTCGRHHQYPDGFALFLGTMFAPTKDRSQPGQGFTHAIGDTVIVRSRQLGSLVNCTNTSDAIPEWTYGCTALMRDLSRRGLLGSA